MKSINYLPTFFSLFLIAFSANCQSKIQDFDFLIGTWKVENKEKYEVWEKANNNNQLVGKSYNMKEGQKIITETLVLKKVKDTIIYEPTVLNQNDGKPIPFALNTEILDMFSFENANHDFPKKIQYKKLNKNSLLVNVLGSGDKGFSIKLIRQIK